MNDKIKSLRPRFVGKTEVRASIQRMGQSSKIKVTVLTYSPAGVTVAATDRRAKELAVAEAIKRGAASADCTILHGGEIKHYATDSQGKRRPINIRSATFYFQAVD